MKYHCIKPFDSLDIGLEYVHLGRQVLVLYTEC